MSGIIHFTSGKTLDITEVEFSRLAPSLNMRGIKTKTLASGHIVPLNSTTMEYVEHVPEEIIGYDDTIVLDQTRNKPNKTYVIPGEPMIQEVEKPKVKTNEEMIAEITEKSNCKHKDQDLYIQHTAKGIRYFPVCCFCGKRERYVSESKIVKGEYEGTPNEKWGSDDIANAKPWIEG